MTNHCFHSTALHTTRADAGDGDSGSITEQSRWIDDSLDTARGSLPPHTDQELTRASGAQTCALCREKSSVTSVRGYPTYHHLCQL